LGQISLPVINRSGIYSHWASSGDNIYNYSKLLKQNIFMRILITTFFKKKFFVFNHIKKNTITKSESERDELLTLSIYNDIKVTLRNRNSPLDTSFFFKKITNEELTQRELGASYNESEAMSFLDLAKLINQKTAFELPIYAGRLLFIKQQGALICLACFFQPPKGDFKAVKQKKKKTKRNLVTINISRCLKLSKFYKPVYFDKNTF